VASDGTASTITVDRLTPAIATDVVQMMARAFVTNPLHVAAFGSGELARNAAFFRAAFAVLKGPKWVASDRGRVFGAIHWVHSSECQLSALEKLAMMQGMIQGLGLRSSMRVAAWMSAWSKHDPREPHVHLGPIGVDPAAQRRGIGALLMERYCGELEKSREAGSLETDRTENVSFYRRFGFEVTHETSVLGVRNYFMWRNP